MTWLMDTLKIQQASDKLLKFKAFSIAKNPKYDGYQRGIASMVFKFFDKKPSGGASKSMSNEHHANKLYKTLIENF